MLKSYFLGRIFSWLKAINYFLGARPVFFLSCCLAFYFWYWPAITFLAFLDFKDSLISFGAFFLGGGPPAQPFISGAGLAFYFWPGVFLCLAFFYFSSPHNLFLALGLPLFFWLSPSRSRLRPSIQAKAEKIMHGACRKNNSWPRAGKTYVG